MARSSSVFTAVLLCLLSVGSSHAASSPVERVVNLLEELKTRIQGDATREQQMYDKYACWCEATTAHKAEAIESAKTQLTSLGQQILGLKGKVATLSAEIESTTAKIEENQLAQKQATAIREKENAAFMAETAEMKQALAALEKAMYVLGGATGGSSSAYGFLQHSEEQRSTAVQKALEAMPLTALQKLEPERLSLIRSYAKEMMHAEGRDKARYAPQSLTIQGILEEMYSTFSTDLQTSTATEATRNKDFEEFMATKAEELAALEDMLRKHIADKAEAEQMLAEAVQTYDDVEAQMKADVEFFDTTKTGCQAKSAEWSQRKALRDAELKGIDEALEILSSDEARELFGKSIKAGIKTGTFLQLSGISHHAAVKPHSQPVGAQAAFMKAFKALKAKATASHSLRLATLAATVKTADVGHFDKVLEAIDTMIQVLKDEQAEDFAKRDQCVEQYKEINSTIANLTWQIEKNNAKITKLIALIAQRKEEKEATIKAIEENRDAMKTMTDRRGEENEAYLADKKDDLDAIDLLEQAKAVFVKYYEENGIDIGAKPAMSLIDRAGAPTPAFVYEEPEFEFSRAGHRKVESGGIVKLMQVIIEDLHEELRTSKSEEAAAQLAYEEGMQAALKLEGELNTTKVNLEEAIADRTVEKTDEEGYLQDNEKALKEEENYKEEIEPDCDWIIGAFDERKEKRAAEMEGLTQAKAFLAGYKESQEG
mmetsp:Transcript_45087/g.107153  ORF Transcript_45087/g.107153 Transcript_45087/m.107153 type:complete len:714 (+) Transcript_45087:61-2202(+)|eukprot:CAMPEP_0178411392 /NCGR_PEP_ID=MMETSP0689_2-20121128/21471_1 /TAXON_ID=160604 /ORGANISM="Amphidinium massartii, Strain CS-259" /LENGTH=713 /DNA_ID=CAMNT_0020032597 /DNA_START=16 /DNA_END=2157 /DNA_ORIENTATION=-